MSLDYPFVIKDVLPIKKFISLRDEFVDGWTLINSSDNKVHDQYKNFWGIGEQNTLPIMDAAVITKLKVQKYLKTNLRLIKCHINGQTFGQTGRFHTDFPETNIWTFVLFCADYWETNWGGEFVCYNPIQNQYRYVPYIPNTGCLIPSNWEHYGSAPSQMGVLRTSLAFGFCDVRIPVNALLPNHNYIKKYL
jgi:hypothetical protein